MPEGPLGVSFPSLEVLPCVFSYIGPGAGLTVIGAALALLFGIVVTIVGLVWYPLKRLLRIVGKSRSGAPTKPPPSADHSMDRADE